MNDGELSDNSISECGSAVSFFTPPVSDSAGPGNESEEGETSQLTHTKSNESQIMDKLLEWNEGNNLIENQIDINLFCDDGDNLNINLDEINSSHDVS